MSHQDAKRPRGCFPSGLVLLLIALLAGVPTAGVAREADGDRAALRPGVRAGHSRLPLAFEPGPQTGGAAEFVARGPGYALRLGTAEQALFLAGPQGSTASVLRVRLVGGSPAPRLEPVDELPGKVHYLLGGDRARWRTHVPLYRKVAYRDVYPGIDLVFYGSERQLEFDFVVGPGADPGVIALAFDGGEPLGIDGRGDVRLRTPAGEVRLERPRLYQEVGGRRRDVPGDFVLDPGGRLSFRVGHYDGAHPLVIDPVLVYSTYLGGNGPAGQPYHGGTDEGRAIAVDAAGNAYVTGSTNSPNFSATSGSPPAYPGHCFAQEPCPHVFVTKFDPAGQIVFSTVLGGGENDWANAIALDGGGHIYLAGATHSPDFPTTAEAFQRVHGPTTCGTHYFSWPCADAFVAKLTPDWAGLVYSTFLGGAGVEEALGLAVDSAGQAHVVGTVQGATTPGPPGPAPDFPTVNALQPTYGGSIDGFVAKLNASGSALVYSTYLGGSGTDTARAVALDGDANAHVAGGTASPDFPRANAFQATLRGASDAFVVKLGPGGALVFGTYLGGSGSDEASAIALDPARNIYVAGQTTSTSDFPTKDPLPIPAGGQWDVFVTKLTPAGAGLSYSTLFGGSVREWAYGIAVDGGGSAYVTGLTTSADMPVVNPVQPLLGNAPCPYDGCEDAFVIKLGPGGLAFATYLGGNNSDVARGIGVDAAGNVYVTGTTWSPDFLTVNAAQATCPGGSGGVCGTDAFVAKISLEGGAPPPLHQLTFRSPPAGTPNPVASEGTVQLSVDAVDTLCHPLTYEWTAICGFSPSHGTFSNASSASPTWTAPANTTGGRLSCGISVTVDDGHGLRQTARYPQWIDPSIGHVMRIVMGPLGTPNPVRSGGTAVPSIVVADSFNHPLSYTWTASCPGLPGNGAFGDSHRLSPDWTAPVNHTGVAQACRVEVTVSDGEGLSVVGAYEQLVNPDGAAVAVDMAAAVNQDHFTPGQTLATSLRLENAGSPGALDFYVGVILPDGETVVCLIDGGRAIAFGRLSDPGTFRPIAVGVAMATPLAVTVQDLMTYVWTGSEPPGTYLFFVVAARPGTFDAANVVTASIAAFAFAP